VSAQPSFLNPPSSSRRVLVAPLNWGLGHATRCIPIIEELLRQNAEVILASDGRAYELLQQEFPNLTIEKLPSYHIRYPSGNMIWNMAWQMPRIARAVWQEHRVLKKLIQKYQIERVISDNRFGCFSRIVPSVFITHQLNILVPHVFLQTLARLVNRFCIRQFSECWIPDVPGEQSLAGKLAHSKPFKKIRYVGILSRMKPMQMPIQYDAIVVLSGPEPQRTRLEALVLKQLANLSGRFLVVQGKPERLSDQVTERLSDRGQVVITPFLKAEALNAAMAASEVVIARAGYSTIMDLAMLSKKAILLPTPGQTEQEYLAVQLFTKNIFYYQAQSKLDLAEAFQNVQHFSGLNGSDYQHSTILLQQTLQSFLSGPRSPNNQ